MPERPLAFVPPWRWWTGFFVVAGAASYVTLLAYREGIPLVLDKVWQFDKLLHFVAAGLLAFFLDGALRRRTLLVVGGLAIPLAAVAVLVPAAIEECLQSFSAVRTASIWDFSGDVAGVLVFIPLSRRLAK